MHEDRPPRGQRKTDPDHNHTGDCQRNVTGKVSITGKVEADFPPHLVEQYKAYSKDDAARENIRFILEWVTLIVVSFYASLTLWQGCSNQRMAEAAALQTKLLLLDRRPYVQSAPKLTFYDSESHQEIAEPIIGKPIDVGIAFENTGNSAALNFYTLRFIRFGPQARSIFSESGRYKIPQGETLMPRGTGSTSAISRQDDERLQSAYVKGADLVNWDGSRPIDLLVYFFYHDNFGGTYCTRIANEYLGHGAWLVLSDAPVGLPCEDKPNVEN